MCRKPVSHPTCLAELASLLSLPRKVAPGCQAQGRALLLTSSLCFGVWGGMVGCRLSLFLSLESCFLWQSCCEQGGSPVITREHFSGSFLHFIFGNIGFIHNRTKLEMLSVLKAGSGDDLLESFHRLLSSPSSALSWSCT